MPAEAVVNKPTFPPNRLGPESQPYLWLMKIVTSIHSANKAVTTEKVN